MSQMAETESNQALQNQNPARPRGTDGAKVMLVIVTESLEGTGSPADPCRIQKRYWSLDGELLATGSQE